MLYIRDRSSTAAVKERLAEIANDCGATVVKVKHLPEKDEGYRPYALTVEGREREVTALSGMLQQQDLGLPIGQIGEFDV